MKNKYLIPALVILILAGCYKEQEPIQEGSIPRKGTFNFSSSTGEVTKVLLNSDNSLFWAAGDKIAVYDYKAGSVYAKDIAVLTGGESTAVGTFTPAVKTTNTDWYNAADASDQVYNFYAFYPGGTEAVNPTDGKVTVSVAASQQESVGIGKYIVSWASANTTKQNLAGGSAPNFAFAPKSALLKLTICNNTSLPAKISSLCITAGSGGFAGDASLNLATGTLSGTSSSSVTYVPSNPIEIAAGATASMPVLISLLPSSPGTLGVSMNHAGYMYTVSDITLATIESGHVYAKTATITAIERGITIENTYSNNLLSSADMVDNATPEYYYYGTANSIVFPSSATSAIINIEPYKASVSATDSDNKFLRKAASAGKNSDARTAKVIWAEGDLYFDEEFRIVSGNTIRLVLSKSAGTKGNALVGIYDSLGQLLWSYHVWCPADSRVVSTEDSFFTAYNLALGQIESEYDTYMYYQWGRKDPLGRAKRSVNELLEVYGAVLDQKGKMSTGEVVNNLDYSRLHPNTFITEKDNSGQANPHDWFPVGDSRDSQNDYLWKYDGAPTIYDPCPQGYHIPSKDDNLWGSTSGKTPSISVTRNGLVYILGGCRNPETGIVANVAAGGYYWTSQALGGEFQDIYRLGFNADTGLSPAFHSSRPFGFGVRCVKGGATSGSKRELAISNGNTSNLANSAALDAAYADDATDPSSLYYGAANCVVMGASDTRALIDIRLLKSSDGYSRSGADASPKVTAVKKAKVIWAESDLYYDPAFAIPEGNSNQIIVTKSAGVTGNALVGIYDESNKLLWSYHIWCPADRSIVSATSEDASPVTFQAYKLALGQIHGADCDTYMYYQWGRKDPLGRAVSSFDNNLIQMHGDIYPTSGGTNATATESTTDNRSYARKNPTIFIKQNDTKLYDWYPATSGTARTSDSNTGGQNDNLWKSDRATIFDPCPQGYHVAPRELWAGSAEKAEGPLFSTAGLWYVLGGNRSGNEGAVGGLLAYGRYWSSEVQGGSLVDAWTLSFRPASGLVGRNGNVRRSDGHGVRCVKY